ncbi:magnesium transporter [Candidatus Cytomitobacter indipagum]|uniref:Magnesium transporter MgtE n=1 Tax=Candidatus Cytomitobacter indipagum TaxID=2601575 RepID=A0A5C0UEE3_9PROT|nr:magnesium transporter [Candidatus Cytomitobacter indipagum]QEK38070.1 magnesium transporter [Candidatus Cytomitobacter indipagum]
MNKLPIEVHRYENAQRRIASIISSLNSNSISKTKGIFKHIHASEAAIVFHFLSQSQREKLINILGSDFDPYILAFLDDEVREEIVDSWANDQLGHALSSINEYDALEILSELHPEQKKAILKSVKPEVRIFLEEGLSYPEKSAGRLMCYQVVALPQDWTIEKAVSFLAKAKHLPEEFYVIFVVDNFNKPVGVIKLQDIYRQSKSSVLSHCMEEVLFDVSATIDQEELALLFRQYSVIAAPVVNNNGSIIGTVNANTIVNIIFKESEEDLLHMVGVEDSGFHSNILETAQARFKWLFVSSCMAMLSASVIGMFQGVISTHYQLSIVLPMTATMGGNSGMQVVAVIIRALSNKQISMINIWRVLRKEILVGLHNGFVFAIIFGTIAYFFISSKIAIIFGIAIMLNIVWSGFIGMILPIFLDRMNMDPALSAASFLTAMTDMMGYAALLLIASYFLN